MKVLGSIPYLSLIAAIILMYWPRQIARTAMKAMPGGYDNADPRTQQEKLTGVGRRALNAHLNGIEAFALFGISVLAAVQRGVDPRFVAVLCVVFLVARIAFVLAYLRDSGGLRSAMFSVAALACVILLGMAAFAGV